MANARSWADFLILKLHDRASDISQAMTSRPHIEHDIQQEIQQAMFRRESISQSEVARRDVHLAGDTPDSVITAVGPMLRRANKNFGPHVKTLVKLTQGATIKVVLTPRFTLRRLLLLVTLCAVLSLVPAAAAHGTLWIVGIAMAVLAAVVMLLVGVLLYLVTMLAGQLINRSRRR